MSTPPESTESSIQFKDLGLSNAVMQAVNAVGYETPSPIQAATIPPLLEGRDLLGQAQTGTGKTAAFALPILSQLQTGNRAPAVLVLAPTRELAIQVAEAFQRYAAHQPGFHVLPIYGGQGYQPQLAALRRGVDVVVGTPGRVMDHIKRGTLKLDKLKWLVLDEADEMLRMGFIDDVEWVFEHSPPDRQVALFSATMPAPIRRIARKHLKDPVEITIESKTTTAMNIRQRYWVVAGVSKLEALTRILEAEAYDGVLIFARTRKATDELSERLAARGYACAALNGDIAQNLRERTVNKLKQGQLDVIVATDVAARGLDVERVSHVINFDIPHDTESYVHRIGRTGRAGRTGDAILFVTNRERQMLKSIERATRQKIEAMALPSVDEVNEQRVARFKQRIVEAGEADDLEAFRSLVSDFQNESGISMLDLAAALARMAQGDEPLLRAPSRKETIGKIGFDDSDFDKRKTRGRKDADLPRVDNSELETYRLAVGRIHKVEARNIVGAIANEANIEPRFIGRIALMGDHCYVDLPKGMPADVFEKLGQVQIAGRALNLYKEDNPRGRDKSRSEDKPRPKKIFKAKPKTSAAKLAKKAKKKLKKAKEKPASPGE